MILDLPEGCSDTLGVSFSQDGYNWFVENSTDNEQIVWCGLYVFTYKQDLLRCLALHRSDFIQAVQSYRKLHDMDVSVVKKWFDLGHVNTYFRSRAEITTQRSFNELVFENGVLYKTGDDKKINAEAHWFKSVPVNLRRFLPQLIDSSTLQSENTFYALEYLPNLPLNELFVHGKNHVHEWNIVFSKIREFLTESSSVSFNFSEKQLINNDYDFLIRVKTFQRMEEFSLSSGFDFDSPAYYSGIQLPSITEICNICINKSLKLNSIYSIMHGDLCLSNILFDSRTQSIKVIDPRGISADGCLSILGNQVYDLAKLTHSFIGLYDHIIAGRFKLINYDSNDVELHFDIDDRVVNIQKAFSKMNFIDSVSIDDVIPLVVLLFISMLPLHSDRPDRQQAMLINALRLYCKYLSP